MKLSKNIYAALLLVLVLGACKVSKDIPLPAKLPLKNSEAARKLILRI